MCAAPIRRPRPLAKLSWISSMVPNEAPIVHAVLVAAPGVAAMLQGDVTTPSRWMLVASASVVVAVFAVVSVRAFRARGPIEHALAAVERAPARRLPRPGWSRVARELLVPVPVRPPSVKRIRGLSYGPDPEQVLDLYLPRSGRTVGTFIHLHGGGFRTGGRSREGRSLLYRLASNGWTCVSADYHLSRTPGDGFPRHLVDVKRLLAWVRREGGPSGLDRSPVILSGSSAGAHLTVMAGLTANDPRLQPGFEQADTTIDAGIGLYGYYGSLGGREHPVSTSPLAHVRPDAPPLLIVHGTHDTYTPVEGARTLVASLRSTSTAPVAYAELPGAQHSFDLLASVRFDLVVDGVERFVEAVRTRRATAPLPDR
jgi:acetyl esterase/lipase